MKVVLFYKSKPIGPSEKERVCFGLTWVPKTYIRRIYVNAVDNPEYPVPLGYWEWTTIERRPTFKERWGGGQYYVPICEQYDCTVPDQIAEKILAKLGWEDSSNYHRLKDKCCLKRLFDEELKGWLKYLSDEELKWWLLVKHLTNETEYDNVGARGSKADIWNVMAEAEAKEIESDLPEDSTLEEIEIWEAEIERRKAERSAEKKREQAKRIYEI